MTGIILVSHSARITEGLKDLLDQIASKVPITLAGGLPDGLIGTDFESIAQAIEDNPAQTILAFYDLGSARMNLDLVKDMSEKEIRIYDIPLIEGAYAAAALLQADVDLKEIESQLKELRIKK